jgi:diguanylate cyclase (GGDEF)-like protein
MVDLTLKMLPMPSLVIDLVSQTILDANTSAEHIFRLPLNALRGRPVDEVIIDWSVHMQRTPLASGSGMRQFASRSRRSDDRHFQGTWRTGPSSDSGDQVIAMLVHCPPVTQRGLKRRGGIGGPSAAGLGGPETLGVDHLTGVGDRWVLESLVEAALSARSERAGEDFGLLLVDLDDFKTVNDQFGHVHGDRVLAVIAERLVGIVRPTDHVTRYGGDEFVIYADPINSIVDLQSIAARIHHAVVEPIPLSDGELRISASVGMAIGSESRTLPGLVDVADRGMYAAKRSSSRRSSTVDG